MSEFTESAFSYSLLFDSAIALVALSDSRIMRLKNADIMETTEVVFNVSSNSCPEDNSRTTVAKTKNQ